MGNQAGREKSIADTNVKREASDLVTQYRNLKGKNDRLSVKKLRQSELSMLSDLDERKSQDIEKMLDQMFADEKDIDFRKFLKWEITKGGSSEERLGDILPQGHFAPRTKCPKTKCPKDILPQDILPQIAQTF